VYGIVGNNEYADPLPWFQYSVIAMLRPLPVRMTAVVRPFRT
jgi:hypothetical protein